MTDTTKVAEANRHHGGPGSSHQRADRPDPTKAQKPQPGMPTNTDRSDVSGGGGVRDRHHTHDPGQKGGQS